MKVVVICEFSGTVRDAFIKKGHEAISYDILPTESQGPHHQGDILDLPFNHWKQYDLAICHPPCTHLAISGARWFCEKSKEQEEALNFVKYLMLLPIERICIENPVSIISGRIRQPDQIIQPYEFGHGESKKTCLWLKNLPKLKPTSHKSDFDEIEEKIHNMPPSKDRGKLRSVFYKGIAEAMADQWNY